MGKKIKEKEKQIHVCALILGEDPTHVSEGWCKRTSKAKFYMKQR